jgi:hypothetical protein
MLVHEGEPGHAHFRGVALKFRLVFFKVPVFRRRRPLQRNDQIVAGAVSLSGQHVEYTCFDI